MKTTLFKTIGDIEVYIIEDGDMPDDDVDDFLGDDNHDHVPEVEPQEHKKIMQEIKSIMIPRSVVNNIEAHGEDVEKVIMSMIHGERPN